VAGIATSRQAFEERLSKIPGAASVKADIRYPFDYARRVNLGEVAARQGATAAALERSGELLAAVERGEDPLAPKAGSAIERHYSFEQAGAIMPYRVYIPSAYDGETRLPLVIALHGQGGTEATLFERDNRSFSRLADQYGFIGVTVLGYSSTGGYGRQAENPDPARARESKLSEEDVLNVLSQVEANYLVDPDRRFLMGHSMGGNGTWYLGAKYAEKWAAIAPIAAGQTPSGEEIERLKEKGVRVFVAHGDADVVTSVEASRRAAALLEEAGVPTEYFELAEGSHSSIVSPAMERIFAFFARQPPPRVTRNR
jgi:poly(3-hydroxybutyrate) depolymerase